MYQQLFQLALLLQLLLLPVCRLERKVDYRSHRLHLRLWQVLSWCVRVPLCLFLLLQTVIIAEIIIIAYNQHIYITYTEHKYLLINIELCP
ncbi:hypothetical protein EB796_021860 [Bugula neritina]|uniref:Uncharacterized protein n=1 Tax=Bugula neritina TaxID=10212 RepID=A0A7J7J2C1_BUGNE|nr:hypothetical protein EB796_021860 [Bugula neritina]